jgi:hypothetical protein
MKLLATILLTTTALAGCVLETEEKNVGNTNGDTGNAAPDHVFQKPRWALSLGNTGPDGALGVAIDPAGDVIAGGVFSGNVDFGTQTLSAAGGMSSWLSKRAGSDGSELWTDVIGTAAAGNATIYDVAAVPDGSIIIAGSFNGDLALCGPVLHGPAIGADLDSFVAKYDTSGNCVWANALDPSTSNQETSLAVGADGRVAMASTYTTADNVGTFFLTVFDADGTRSWQVTSTNANIAASPSVVMTGEDDIVLSGAIQGSMTLDAVTLTSKAYWSAFVARFTLGGALLWAHEIGDGSDLDRPGPIAIGANNEVVLTSTLEPAAGDGSGTAAVASVDPTGAPMWSTSGGATPWAATVLPNGMIITAGNSSIYPVDYGWGPMIAGTFFAAYDANGRTLDAIGYNAANDNVNLKLASGENAFAYVAAFSGALDFGTGPLRYAGDGDALIVMMDVAQP